MYIGIDHNTVNMVSVDNGFNPIWNETCVFDIINPELAMIRFMVQDEDMFGDPNFLGQATLPVPCMKSGIFIYICAYSLSISIRVHIHSSRL